MKAIKRKIYELSHPLNEDGRPQYNKFAADAAEKMADFAVKFFVQQLEKVRAKRTANAAKIKGYKAAKKRIRQTMWDKASRFAAIATFTSRATYEEVRNACMEMAAYCLTQLTKTETK